MYAEDQGLNSTCAQFVQILHTSKIFGTPRNLGHTDFYANKKESKQPGCLLDTCNHSRAIELYYSSCFKEHVFIGTDCTGAGVRSKFGFYNDGKEGCYDFDTSNCFPYD